MDLSIDEIIEKLDELKDNKDILIKKLTKKFKEEGMPLYELRRIAKYYVEDVASIDIYPDPDLDLELFSSENDENKNKDEFGLYLSCYIYNSLTDVLKEKYKMEINDYWYNAGDNTILLDFEKK